MSTARPTFYLSATYLALLIMSIAQWAIALALFNTDADGATYLEQLVLAAMLMSVIGYMAVVCLRYITLNEQDHIKTLTIGLACAGVFGPLFLPIVLGVALLGAAG